MRRTLFAILAIGAMISLSSCASVPPHHMVSVPKEYSINLAPSLMGQDLYHTVMPHETLWRISKMYGTSVDSIMQANNLTSPQGLEIGQRLRIPSAMQAMPSKPAFPLFITDQWQFIIIHHSATNKGSASFFSRAHQRRGFWKGVGYDFIIDNGSFGKLDGQIEVSPRWLQQEDGAHCRASGMNHRGIGICLVGNFSRQRPTEKQLDALVYLVDTLRRYYNIPVSRIMGHGRVYGAHTECPGSMFPWGKFYQKLNTIGHRRQGLAN